MIFQLFAGILIAVCVFVALLWSIYRAVVTTGRLRMNAAMLSVATVVGMASISLNAPLVALFAGGACVTFALAALWTETRWNKLLPLAQLGFGAALIARLPWGGA